MADARGSRIRRFVRKGWFRGSYSCISGYCCDDVSSERGSDRELLLSAEEAHGAQIAVLCAGEPLAAGWQDWLVLLRDPGDEIVNGRIYLVVTEYFYLFCSVYRIEGDDNRLRFRYLSSMVKDGLEIRREEIRVMWQVCGAVCRMK